jgi:hypothetical protein
MEIKSVVGAVVVGLGGGFLVGEARAQATEGVMPVGVGVVRVDADLYARGEDWRTPAGGSRARSDAWGYVQFATGLTEWVEVRAAWETYRREASGGATVSGAGDVFLSAKIRLAGDEAEGVAWAVLPYVKLPTAGAKFADDTVDAGALVVVGAPLGEAGYFNAQAGWDDYGDGAGGRDGGASASAVVGRAVGERWTVYAETLAGVYPLTGDSDAFALSAGAGVTWAGDADGTWGLDVAAYGGVTRAAKDVEGVLRFWLEWGGR